MTLTPPPPLLLLLPSPLFYPPLWPTPAICTHTYSGKSKGTAVIVFERRADAMSAVTKYNNVSLDKQPMRIELVEAVAPPGTLKTLSSGIK